VIYSLLALKCKINPKERRFFMEKVKRDEKMEEIKVLDKGKNIDDIIFPMAICCGATLIPFRG
jgi:hypothetical protein